MSLSTNSIQIVLMFLVIEIKKDIKDIRLERKQKNWLTVDMIAYVENLMKSIFLKPLKVIILEDRISQYYQQTISNF